MSSKRLLLIILIIYLALAGAFSVSIPLGEAPDEADHYAYIVYLGQNRRLPQGTTVTQSKHPPLYHATVAAATAWTGLDFTFLRSNPDALPLGPGKPPNFFVHTSLEDFPWRGGALAMHLARFLSIVLGAVTIWAAWRLGLAVFPRRPAIGLLAAAFLAGLPGFLFISGSINNDNAAGAFGALAVLLCAVLLRRGLRWQQSLLLGVCLGLGLLSKVGTLALWPLALLAVGGAWWLSGEHKRTFWRAMAHIALIYGTALLVASPWLLRNWRLYGDPLAWDLVRATVDQRLAPLTWADIGWLLRGFHTSFWGRFAAAGQVVLPGWAFALALVFTAVVIAGGVWYVVNSRRQKSGERQGDTTADEDPRSDDFSRPGGAERLKSLLRREGSLSGQAQRLASAADHRVRFWLLLTLLAAAPLLMFLSVVRYSAIALGTDQARLMFPALSAMAVWVGMGVVGLVDGVSGKRGKDGKGVQDRVVVVGFAGGMAVFGLVVLLGVIKPAFAPPQPVASAGSQTAEALAAFAGLELAGVELPAQPLAVGEPAPIRLLWRAAAPLGSDLRPAVRLVHADGWLAAEWGHSPAGGRYSTDRWRPGEVYADDYLLAPVPATPGVYTVAVAVRPFGGDWVEPMTQQQRLPVDAESPETPLVVLGTIVWR